LSSEAIDVQMALLQLRRRHQEVFRRREQLQERVGHYPNPVNTRQLAELLAQQAAMELQIARLEAI
jgi:hypothetical protein